jgi:amino acid transporter
MYVFRKPSYRGNSVLLITCVFGISFVFLGNMFANCINFARCVLLAAGHENPTHSAVTGITISVAILTCFIHAFSRRGGIWLSNMLAMIKVATLLFIIVTAIVVGAGGLPQTANEIATNTNTERFKDASNNANGYAHAFLAVIFSFSGFEQPNYVLGEISNPRRKFPISMGIGVSLIGLLYMAVNIAYNVVVPHEDQIKFNVAQRFIELTFGALGQSPSDNTAARIFNAFLALSSLGNVIVMVRGFLFFPPPFLHYFLAYQDFSGVSRSTTFCTMKTRC